MTGYPDYPKQERITNNTDISYTIKRDRFVRFFAQSSANGAFAAYLKINGGPVFNACLFNATVGTELSSQLFPVKAGDIIEQYGSVNLNANSGVRFIEKR